VKDQLYVRIRGRVQGPFDEEKLRALVRRGQLSRMHEVSLDGDTWKQASEYSELFATEAKQVVQESQPVAEDEEFATENSVWYYSVNGLQSGPVTFEQLQSQASPGHLSSDDLVWKEGMKEWVPGRTIPGLLFGTASTIVESASESTTSAAKLGGSLIRTLKDSQAWIRFISYYLFMNFFCALLVGLLFVIIGIHGHSGIPIGLGIYWLVYAAIFFYGGWLLHSYRKKVVRVLQDRSPARLDDALRSLRTLWIYVSIIFIVWFVNGIVAVVLVLSGVVDPRTPFGQEFWDNITW